MSTPTARLALPLIDAAQAQKHVTHNEALLRLDALVHLAVASRAGPLPAAPAADSRRIVAAGDPGAGAGHAGKIALFDGAWRFLAPRPGWRCFVEDEDALLVWTGADWRRADIGDRIAALGVNTAPAAGRRLSVKSDAVLLSHDDVTPGEGDMRLTLNKAAAARTASLLMQSNWSGRAELGLTGTDDLVAKVSSDGAAWREALRIDRSTGRPSFPSGVTFTPDQAIGRDYVAARGFGAIANATGLMGTNYNFPNFALDRVVSPNLPGAFRYTGYYGGLFTTDEFIPVDPNSVYRLSLLCRQASAPGDWTAWPNRERHQHYVGFECYDVDGLSIRTTNYERFKEGGADSLTTLTQPLAPGDMLVRLADATGWNTTNSAATRRAISILEYRNSFGYLYEGYTRHVATGAAAGAFDLAGVDKTAKTVTLKAPWALPNPAAVDGVWPAGTRIANAVAGGGALYSLMNPGVLNATNVWRRFSAPVGGVNVGGGVVMSNFPPGTALVKPLIGPNFTNRPGGHLGFPDTGAGHSVWFAAPMLRPVENAAAVRQASGVVLLYGPSGAPGATTMGFGPLVAVANEEI